MKRSVVGSLVSCSAVTFGVAALVSSFTISNAKAIKSEEAVPGEILVSFRSHDSLLDSRARVAQSLIQVLGSDAVRSVTALQMDASIAKVVLKDSTKTRAAISQLTSSLASEVKYAEPNFIYHADVIAGSFEAALPNDPKFNDQWDMKNTGQIDKPGTGQAGTEGRDINIVPLWNEGVTGERKLLVAVIDTGIDYTHPDLAANIFKNEKEIPENGIDDDENGVIDDVYGANFETGAGVGNGLDDNNHGSHCAGTIGAVGNDSNGISGVNWIVSMIPAKFLSAAGSGTLEGAVNAIKYGTKMGAKVSSNSWGGGSFSETLRDAIQEAGDSGSLFIAAAGNDSVDNDADPHYPSNYELSNVIAVAATDNRDALASFSNYGKNTVHVSAPGKNILSTVKGGDYAIYSGTSMAAPHVSGIAALIWGANPSWTAAEVKERLITTSTPVAALKKKSVSRGRVNAYNAFHKIVTPSDDPSEDAWKDVAYALESTHPYADGANLTWEISAPGAKFLRIVFERVETEPKYDTLTLETKDGEVIETISGVKAGEYISEYIKSDQVVLRLKSDASVPGFGFKISKIQVVD